MTRVFAYAFVAGLLVAGTGGAAAQQQTGARARNGAYIPSTHSAGCSGLLCDGNDPERAPGAPPPPPCQGLICGISPYSMQRPVVGREAERLHQERARGESAVAPSTAAPPVAEPPTAEPPATSVRKSRPKKTAKVAKRPKEAKLSKEATPQKEAAPRAEVEPRREATPRTEAKPQREATPRTEPIPQREATLPTEPRPQRQATPRTEAMSPATLPTEPLPQREAKAPKRKTGAAPPRDPMLPSPDPFQ